MNTEQFKKKNIGQTVRLRPHPLLARISWPEVVLPVLTSGGPVVKKEFSKTDYDWRIEDVTDKGVRLRCLYTGHTIALGADNVREYRTPHFLMLKCQLTLDGDNVHMEPM